MKDQDLLPLLLFMATTVAPAVESILSQIAIWVLLNSLVSRLDRIWFLLIFGS